MDGVAKFFGMVVLCFMAMNVALWLVMLTTQRSEICDGMGGGSATLAAYERLGRMAMFCSKP